VAAKEVGCQMLQKRNPAVFGRISQMTINKWIDRSGTKPKWSENTLQLAENGNHQCHPNGGRRGALVNTIIVTGREDLIICVNRLVIQMSLIPLRTV
jgi:hypothetical protein